MGITILSKKPQNCPSYSSTKITSPGMATVVAAEDAVSVATDEEAGDTEAAVAVDTAAEVAEAEAMVVVEAAAALIRDGRITFRGL